MVVLVVRKVLTCETRLERAGKRQTVYDIIHGLHELNTTSLRAEAQRRKIESVELKEIIVELRQKGLIYSPKPGMFTCVD
ncbi:MAG: hypothetical protein V1875_10230 [Candidatus Altiarchaeota archaeon]